jgi:hypothetical protein
MKIQKILVLAIGIISATVSSSFASVVLSDFNDFASQSPSLNGGWAYTQDASGFISITAGKDDGDFLVVPNNAFNLQNLAPIAVAVTARVDSGNAATSFAVLLYDINSDTATATFNISNFSGAFSTQVASIVADNAFDFSNVVYWQISGGNPTGSNFFRMSFDNAQVQSVPEPSTFALVGLGTAFAGWMARRKKA